MNDYRYRTGEELAALLDAAEADGKDYRDLYARYANGDLPPDRKGLIAVFHPQCQLDDGAVAFVNSMAAGVAARTQQRVYIVMTEGHWHMLLFALDDGNYDCNENGRFANDKFIGYYEPDGTWRFVGCS